MTQDTSVLTILESENASEILEEKAKEELSISVDSMISVLSAKPLVISGLALVEGTWKGTFYSGDEIRKGIETLTAANVTVEHEATIKYKNRVVGKVIHRGYNEVLKGAEVRAEIYDTEAVNDVLRGVLRALSVRVLFDKEKRGFSTAPTARNIRFDNVTLTKMPACEVCLIMNVERKLSLEDASAAYEYQHDYDELGVWTRAYINDLPDSAFLVVESGGEKVEGKTVPRNLRHLPVKDAAGKIDCPHVDNALKRMKQVKPINMSKEAFIAKARSAIRPYLKSCGIKSKVMGEETLTDDKEQDAQPVEQKPVETPTEKPQEQEQEQKQPPETAPKETSTPQPTVDRSEIDAMRARLEMLEKRAFEKRFESIESGLKEIKESIEAVKAKPEPTPEPEPDKPAETEKPKEESKGESDAEQKPEEKPEEEDKPTSPLEVTKDISVGELLIIEHDSKVEEQEKRVK